MTHGTRVLFNSPPPFNQKHQRGNMHATHEHVQGKSMVRQFQMSKGRTTFAMQCGFHAYMESWAIVVDSPYFTFTSEAGTYEIAGIPPGTYRLRAWHHSVKQEQIQMVIVDPSKTIQVDFPLRSPTRRWTAHTRLKPPRFTAAVLGRPINIEPLVERQRP